MTSISDQIYVFLATLYGGMIIGFIYDLYRIFRCIFRPKRIATLIEDFIFWIVISIAAMSVLLFSNDGQIRFYNFIGFWMGAFLYNRILSKFVIKIIVYGLRFLKRMLWTIIKVILYPVRALMNLLSIPWRYAKKKIRPIYYRLKRLSTLPKRVYGEIKKYIVLIRKKK